MMLVIIPKEFRRFFFGDIFGPNVQSREILLRMLMQDLKMRKRSLEKKKKESRKDDADD